MTTWPVFFDSLVERTKAILPRSIDKLNAVEETALQIYHICSPLRARPSHACIQVVMEHCKNCIRNASNEITDISTRHSKVERYVFYASTSFSSATQNIKNIMCILYGLSAYFNCFNRLVFNRNLYLRVHLLLNKGAGKW